jgi:protein-S-isoprenylcysteine O-methyltransferase Ste14
VSVRDVALDVVVGCAYLRVGAVLFGAARSLRGRRRTRTSRFGFVEFLAALETVALGGLAYPLYYAAIDSHPSLVRTAAAIIGACLATLYVALLVGSIASWRGVHSGHVVLDGQTLVTTGLYGMIRHPLYAGAFALWAAVAVADLSIVAGAVMLVFVVPTYLAYINREEAMMVTVYGNDFRDYCSAVPRFVPSLHRGFARH